MELISVQPETTHVSQDGTEYAVIDGKWRFYINERVGWVKSGVNHGWHNQNLTPIKKPEINAAKTDNQQELSGGSCNYYMVKVEKPTTLPAPYTIECNDLIEALRLSFKEANIIKEIFRTANERTHGNGKPGNSSKRAAEKVLFFAIRNAIDSGVDIEKFTSEINLK